MVQKENVTVNYRETDGAPPYDLADDYDKKRFYEDIECIHETEDHILRLEIHCLEFFNFGFYYNVIFLLQYLAG